MSLRMAYVTKRDDSSRFQFRIRVPRHVLDRVKGREVLISFPDAAGEPPFTITTRIGKEIKFSLRTSDPGIAEARDIVARAHLQKIFGAAEKGPVPISPMRLVALSKCVYDLFESTFREDPGPRERWVAFKAFIRAAMEGRILSAPEISLAGLEVTEEAAAAEQFGANLTAGINVLAKSTSTTALEQRFGKLTDWLLAQNGYELDLDRRKVLLQLVAKAAHDAGRQLKKYADYDYSPDPALTRFPAVEIAQPSPPPITLTDLFERWRNEVRPAASTVTTWRAVLRSVREHLGHEDPRRIDASDIVAWKDDLVDSGRSPKTIKDTYLTALNVLLN